MSNTNTNSPDFNNLWRTTDLFSFIQLIPFTKWDFIGKNFLNNVLQEEFQHVKIDDETNILKFNGLKICVRLGLYKLNKKFTFSNITPAAECDFIAFIGIAPNSIFLKLVAPSQINTFAESIIQPKKHFGYIDLGNNQQILLTDKTKKNTYSVSFKTDDLTIITGIKDIIDIFGNKVKAWKYEIPQESLEVLNPKQRILNYNELIKYIPFAPQQPQTKTKSEKIKTISVNSSKPKQQIEIIEPIETEQQIEPPPQEVQEKAEPTNQPTLKEKIKTTKPKQSPSPKKKQPKTATKKVKTKVVDDEPLIYVLKKNDEMMATLKQSDDKTHIQEFKNKEMVDAIVLLQDQLEALRVHTMEITNNGSNYIKNLQVEVNDIKEGYQVFESAMNELYEQNQFLLKKLALSRDTWWTPNGVKIWSEPPTPDNSLALRLTELEEAVYKANTIPEVVSTPEKEVNTTKEIVTTSNSSSKFWKKCKNIIKVKPATPTSTETPKIESSGVIVNTQTISITNKPTKPVIQQPTITQPIQQPVICKEHYVFGDLEPFKDNTDGNTTIHQPITQPTPLPVETTIVKQIIVEPEIQIGTKPELIPQINVSEPTINTQPVNDAIKEKEVDFGDFDNVELTPFSSTPENITITPNINNLETTLPDISEIDWDSVTLETPQVDSVTTTSNPVVETETWTNDTASNNDDDWLF